MTQPSRDSVDTSDEEIRPFAFHVEKISFDVSLKHTYRKRVAVIDLELTYPLVLQMIKELEQRAALPGQGTIRVRLKGRMVLE